MVDRDPDDEGTATECRPVPQASNRRAPIDELLRILSHSRRRDVLYCLSNHELASVESVAATIADREAGTDGVSTERRESVRISLSHDHLPKLADRHLIEYDRRSGAIGRTAPGGRLEALLACCHDLETEDVVSR